MSHSAALRSELRGRVDAAHLTIHADVLDACVAYVELLSRWNERMNLTALPLSPPVPARTLDKLIVEPLSATEFLPADAGEWLDLGSGGGSPAIPLRLACPGGSLTMVESRARKCAFLREAVRWLQLERTHVRSERFEELDFDRSISLITIRAVRIDEEVVTCVRRWLRPDGVVLCFGASFQADDFTVRRRKLLPDGSSLDEVARR